VPPTPEHRAKLTLQVVRTAVHSSAPHRILPQIEKLGIERFARPDMIEAARIYAVLKVVSDGPSVGIGRYDGVVDASSIFGRMPTNDERIDAGRILRAAQLAAFGMRDAHGNEVIDGMLRSEIEPVRLGARGKFVNSFKWLWHFLVNLVFLVTA
jgi:hypothetical protein